MSTPNGHKTHLGFLSSNSVDGESTFDVVYETEVFSSLFNGDDIYKHNHMDEQLNQGKQCFLCGTYP